MMTKGLIDFLSNKCPKCRQGLVFTGPYRMNPTCPSCGLKYEREQGYFLGAMVLAYVLSAITVIPTIVYLNLKSEIGFPMIVVLPALQVVLTNPILFMYSRLTWMYIDHHVNPKSWN